MAVKRNTNVPKLVIGDCVLCGWAVVVAHNRTHVKICNLCYNANGSVAMETIAADILKALSTAPNCFSYKQYLRAKGAIKGRAALLRRTLRFMRHRGLIHALDRDTFVSFNDARIFD